MKKFRSEESKSKPDHQPPIQQSSDSEGENVPVAVDDPQFRAKTDRVLAGHLNSDESRAIPKYTSPDIQNEFIELCGDYIRKLLLRDCNNAHSFAFLADEATDSGAKEQISICIRFVQRKEGENKEEAHSLNLAIGRACGEPLIRNMLTTVKTIAFAFDYSAKRLLAFQESLDQNVQVREEMDRRAKLRTLCETRWANRADAPSVQRSHSSFRCSRSCPRMAM
ncbi:hypothetical protein pdam_00010045 [Pocillopora damicornis]|uniref:Uncharacterized protein n=1 Tax=Pocillopora damicornis TaxID=46731 RepID=A0A3M6T502_POCDA|nr:hypothetical protein pdam_00010045 [Pocillopora damicornis]